MSRSILAADAATIVNYRDISVSIPIFSKTSMHKFNNKAFNFLKHADRDYNDIIAADAVNPAVPILEAWGRRKDRQPLRWRRVVQR